MASDTKESSNRNSGSVNVGLSSGDRANDDQNTASTNPQDQVLLQALQNFIVPLIQRQSNEIQTDLGPEAGKLLTALREFISSIVVGSQLSEKKMIEVDLVEGQTKIEGTLADESDEHDARDNASSAEVESPFTESNGVITNKENPVNQAPAFREKVLKALRGLVFNKTPIRLLSFELNRAKFQITLLERKDIYERLVLALPEKLDEPDHRRATDLDPDEDFQRKEEQAIQQLISKHVRYGILSHTWLRATPGEITYDDWNKGRFDTNGPGYTKLVDFCWNARRHHGLTFGWMDTICINKDSSSELDESIRSMCNWYKRASVCIVYLAETGTLQTMHNDPWFTRGWTLQELLAPNVIKFYNMDWKQFSRLISDKKNEKITRKIKQATTITRDELDAFRKIPISRVMELAAKRQVTREEDTAYSLMGIFDISISTAYGEGANRAFSSLLKEVLATTSRYVMDIFNWAGADTSEMQRSQILPDSPKAYIRRSTITSDLVWMMRPIEPFILTHLGLRVPLILMPAISTERRRFAYHPVGDYSAIVRDISPMRPSESGLTNTQYLLEKRVSGPDGRKGHLLQTTFAVFNFTGGLAGSIRIPKTCLAMALGCSEDAGKVSGLTYNYVFRTEAPIVFNLRKRPTVDGNDSDVSEPHYKLKKSELPKHGMQLISLYL